MSHEAAKAILDTILRHAGEQDEVLAKIQGKCTPEEFSEYRTMIGKSMGSMVLDVMNPIIEKYPDLTPPQLK